MAYHDAVGDLAKDPEQLEQVYQSALKAGETAAFKEAIEANHTSAPDNLLYAAWFHRLKYTASQAKGYAVAWAWVAPLAAANALLFWWLSGDQFMITIADFRADSHDFLPALVLLAAPLALAAFSATAAEKMPPRSDAPFFTGNAASSEGGWTQRSQLVWIEADETLQRRTYELWRSPAEAGLFRQAFAMNDAAIGAANQNCKEQARF